VFKGRGDAISLAAAKFETTPMTDNAVEDKSRVMDLQSVLTCPKCGHQSVETMPIDACQFFYDCKGCGARLKPLEGDCCVFCSYGSLPCPPMQTGRCS
jgi:transposase-like protein